jgi:hypothetical protein
VNWNNSEGEVSGDSLDLFFLLMIIDSAKNTGDTYNPPGTKSTIIPMIAGIHHFEFGVWAWEDCFSGIRGL